ncbi:MAG: glycosyltransferase family 25 protein [Luteolibacter sp.]
MPPARTRIYLISLARQQERRERSLRQLEATGWHFELVEGMDALRTKRRELMVPMHAWLNFFIGEVACYHSHLEVFRRIIAANLDYGLILEDDLKLVPDTTMTLATIWDHLPPGADHIQLHNVRDEKFRGYRMLEPGERFNRVSPTNTGGWGYIVSRRLAEYVLEHHSIPRKPMDDVFIQLSRTRKDRFGFYDTVERLVDTHWKNRSSINRWIPAPRSTRLMFRYWKEYRERKHQPDPAPLSPSPNRA